MKYLSVCSGIEAASVAWHELGWQPVAFSEIEAFPSAVLAYHYPNVPNWGDMTKFKEWPDACVCGKLQRNNARGSCASNDNAGLFANSERGGIVPRVNQHGAICSECNGTNVDVLVGGTPCQSFSVAGLRKGLDDPRGNLMLTYLAIADKYRPEWLVWENVPGVLSSAGGRDFAALLRGLAELGYGWAYRVLDAQYFGVAQRRRRVFVVANARSWQRAAAVLFERHSLSGNPAPSRETGQGSAPGIKGCAPVGGEVSAINFKPIIPQGCGGDIAPTLNSAFGSKLGLDNQHIDSGAGLFVRDVMGTITSRMFNALGSRDIEEGAVIPVAFDAYNQEDTGHVSKTVCARNDQDTASLVAHTLRGEGFNASEDGTGRGTPLVMCFDWQAALTPAIDVELSSTLIKNQTKAIAFHPTQDPISSTDGSTHTMGTGSKGGCATVAVAQPVATAIRTANTSSNGCGIDEETPYTLDQAQGQAVAFEPGSIARNAGPAGESSLAPTLRSNMGDNQPAVRIAMQVRRLTPVECERLQGFPDNYTNIPWRKKPEAPDGPRYKALGNSMAVPCMAWIGRRIDEVETLARGGGA